VAETGERTATLLGLNAQAGAEIVVPFFAYLAGEGGEKVAYRIVNLGADAFAGRTEITSLTLLYNITSIQEGFLKGASNLEELIVKDNPSYTLTSTERHKGILFGNGGKTLMAYLPTSTAGAYSVPNGVTRIAQGAFAYSKNLQTLVIPQTVEFIGAGAFAAAGKMTTIECPYNKYYEFNNYALYAEDGTMLHTYLATGRGNSGVLTVGVKVQTINDFAFEGNGELYEIRLPEYQLTDSGKTTISSVNYIGYHAFAKMKNLTKIYIEGYTAVNRAQAAQEGADRYEYVTEEGLTILLKGIKQSFAYGDDFVVGNIEISVIGEEDEETILSEDNFSYTTDGEIEVVTEEDGRIIKSTESVSFNKYLPGTYYVFVTVNYQDQEYKFTYPIVVEPLVDAFGDMGKTTIYAPVDGDVWQQVHDLSNLEFVGYTPKTALDYSVEVDADMVTTYVVVNGYSASVASVLGALDYRDGQWTVRGDLSTLILPAYVYNMPVRVIAKGAFYSTDEAIAEAGTLLDPAINLNKDTVATMDAMIRNTNIPVAVRKAALNSRIVKV
ncbi:MAG: leucine-rich repeat protein, partial [Clostridia bacterium]|nr:leucine-rich repeat protein [Clostridia bacterium]